MSVSVRQQTGSGRTEDDEPSPRVAVDEEALLPEFCRRCYNRHLERESTRNSRFRIALIAASLPKYDHRSWGQRSSC